MAEENKTRTRLLNIFKVAVSLVGVLILVLTQDIEELRHALDNVNWLFFVAALALFLGGSLREDVINIIFCGIHAKPHRYIEQKVFAWSMPIYLLFC